MPSKKRKNRFNLTPRTGCAFALALIFILCLALHAPLLRFAGRRLSAGAALPRRADMIYIYAGGEAERPQYAAKLLKQDRAPIVLTAGGLRTDKLLALGIKLTEAQVNEKVLIRNGVPKNKIRRIDAGTSTWEETRQLFGFVKQHNIKSVLIVTSNFHIRRVRFCVRRIFGRSPVKVYYSYPEHGTTDLDHWWREEDDLITVTNEYQKLLYYLKYLRVKK